MLTEKGQSESMNHAPRETVPALADHVRQRMHELGIDSIAELAAATGLTPNGLAPLLRGERRNYQARLTGPVTRALGWTPDSIDQILAGGEPHDATRRPAPAEAEVRAALSELVELVADQRRQLAEVRQHIAARLDGFDARQQKADALLDQLTADVRRLAAEVLGSDPE